MARRTSPPANISLPASLGTLNSSPVRSLGGGPHIFRPFPRLPRLGWNRTLLESRGYAHCFLPRLPAVPASGSEVCFSPSSLSASLLSVDSSNDHDAVVAYRHFRTMVPEQKSRFLAENISRTDRSVLRRIRGGVQESLPGSGRKCRNFERRRSLNRVRQSQVITIFQVGLQTG